MVEQMLMGRWTPPHRGDARAFTWAEDAPSPRPPLQLIEDEDEDDLEEDDFFDDEEDDEDFDDEDDDFLDDEDEELFDDDDEDLVDDEEEEDDDL